jgi:large subunit ribosomal protein L23
MDLNKVVFAPMLSEKTNLLREKLHKFVFKVHKKANKIEIKKALEKFYNVRVEKVNVMNTRGKSIRFRYKKGIKPGYKKAIVTLREGTFDFFEGV